MQYPYRPRSKADIRLTRPTEVTVRAQVQPQKETPAPPRPEVTQPHRLPRL